MKKVIELTRVIENERAEDIIRIDDKEIFITEDLRSSINDFMWELENACEEQEENKVDAPFIVANEIYDLTCKNKLLSDECKKLKSILTQIKTVVEENV